MPIDLTAAVEFFTARFALQRRGIADAFTVIGKWLKNRLKQAEAIEQASRRYPRIDFAYGGVTLRIHHRQHRTLAPSEHTDFASAIGRGGREFVDGIGFFWDASGFGGRAVTQEWVLPTLLARLRQWSDLLATSARRFSGRELPTSTFDPRHRTGSDIVGLLARGWRALAASSDQIQGLVGQVGQAMDLFRSQPDCPDEGGARSDRAAPNQPFQLPTSLSEQLDQGVRYLAAGLLLLPAIPRYLGLLWEALWLRIRLRLLSEFSAIEQQVFDFRRTVIDFFFTEVPVFMATAFRFALAAEYVIRTNLKYFISFGAVYAGTVIREVRRFASELQTFLDFFITLVEVTRQILEAVMNFDLMPFILPALGLPGAVLALAGAVPTLTLGDLLDAAGHAIRIRVYMELTNFVNSIRGIMLASLATQTLYWRYVKAKLDLTQRILDALFQAPAPYPAETVRPIIPNRFPNLYDAFFGPTGRSFVADFARMGRGLASSVAAILRAGRDTLDRLAPLLAREAAAAARHLQPVDFRLLDQHAAFLTDILYGRQLHELHHRVAAGRRDPAAASFSNWLATGGFELIGAAIPHYIGELRRWWGAQNALGQEATMNLAEVERLPPIARQKVARRLTLARVRLDGLTIEGRGRALDDYLVEQIADRFRRSVFGSYRLGRARLLALQGATT